jgi:chemotaxis protein histidine kinase CheA
MTVSTTIIKSSHNGNGSTTTFAYNFKIFADTDLVVIIRSAAGTETTKTLTTHYTVAGAGDASGGSITFTSGNIPASGETVVIRRNVPQTQAIDYIANDPFPAETNEEGLDRTTMIAQQVSEATDRSIKLSRTNTMTSTEFTVGATERANKILAFDSAGEISVTQELGTFKGTDATVTTEAYNVRDIIKSTTTAELNNVYICVADSVVGDSLTDTDHFQLLVDAVSAATSATAAASSASAASTSASAAATSATNAANSASTATTKASEASTSATNAASSASTASTQASNAASSASAASTSETNAASSASTASTQATNAASSATAAASSATTATTKASEASTSATNAASSATTASTQASNASTSATNAASSATAADTAKTAAQTAQAAAEAAADNFDDTYLGAKASDPTVDNDGDALTAGDLYFNTTSNVLKVYSGSAWQLAAVDATTLASNGFAVAMAIAL